MSGVPHLCCCCPIYSAVRSRVCSTLCSSCLVYVLLRDYCDTLWESFPPSFQRCFHRTVSVHILHLHDKQLEETHENKTACELATSAKVAALIKLSHK